MIDLDAIDKYCREASPGPWYVAAQSEIDMLRAMFPGSVPADVTAMINWHPATKKEAMECFGQTLFMGQAFEHNLKFTANARTDLPLCVAEIRRLRAALAEIRDIARDNDLKTIRDIAASYRRDWCVLVL